MFGRLTRPQIGLILLQTKLYGAVFDGTIFLGEKLVYLSHLVYSSNYMRQIMEDELINNRLIGALFNGDENV